MDRNRGDGNTSERLGGPKEKVFWEKWEVFQVSKSLYFQINYCTYFSDISVQMKLGSPFF